MKTPSRQKKKNEVGGRGEERERQGRNRKLEIERKEEVGMNIE